MNRFLVSFMLLVLLQVFAFAQQKNSAVVCSQRTHATLPFVTVKFAETGRGTIADLDGRFTIPVVEVGALPWIEISAIGYEPQKCLLPLTKDTIFLRAGENALREVVVRPDKDKIKRILDAAIANKNHNNPDKYDWYRCKMYYKMLVDVVLPDSLRSDTSKQGREVFKFLENQHLLMSETYSTRTWKKPQQLQEEVTGSRFSGLQKSMFTGLVTDVLPFHSYNDYITLNGKDYHNPLSRGYSQYYKFRLEDELLQGQDTIWHLSFKPRGVNANDLEGSIYIHSDGFAISSLVASAIDTMLKRRVRIEQQYEQVTEDSITRWFPRHLNYIIEWTLTSNKMPITYLLKGNSLIDSTTFREDKSFHFDKVHSILLTPGADERTDDAWVHLRPIPLDAREARTYKVIDSIGLQYHFDNFMGYLSRLPEGKVPVGIFDLDLKRLVSGNYFEGMRLGLGVQTNEKWIKWLSLGAWAGYGFGDTHWKYGAFAEVYADKTHEFVFKGGYSYDLGDPGRVKINDELDRDYLNYYLLRRVDKVATYYVSVKKKFGYWNLELSGRSQDITPAYAYSFSTPAGPVNSYKANEVSLNFRYAFAERTAPFYGRYYSSGTKYPIWYGKVTTGAIDAGGLNIPYTQALTALAWHKHLNRLGNEQFFLQGGKSWSNGTLPLGKLFAGPGYRYSSGKGLDFSYYSFGGIISMFPYDYYTDQFVSFVFRHDFDWKLYKVKFRGNKFSSAPNIALQYGMLYGMLQDRQAQEQVALQVPDNAYHEAGALINNLIRLNYLDVFYFTLNVGYFYHFAPVTDYNKNGKFVLGLGVEL